MQGLRAKYQIHKGCAFGNGRALLAGDTAADTNNQIWVGLLQVFPATELMKDFFLGPLANRAGVEQDNVGLCRIIRGDHLVAVPKQIAHARRIILIHLAAMSDDMQLFDRLARVGSFSRDFGHGIG